jgi:hypothetical protein
MLVSKTNKLARPTFVSSAFIMGFFLWPDFLNVVLYFLGVFHAKIPFISGERFKNSHHSKVEIKFGNLHDKRIYKSQNRAGFD